MFTVSVVMPTYKCDIVQLKRAIDSVMMQTHENTEVVLVDDNGTDKLAPYREKSKQLAESYGDRIVYVQNKGNIGAAASRNNGIAHSRGEYITFLDDDDRYLPKKVENQLDFMLKNKLDMCFAELRLCNYEEKTVDYREHTSLKAFDRTSLLRYHLMHHITGTPTFMYKKDAIMKIGCFDDVWVSQEYYLMFKTIMDDGIKIGYFPHCDIVAYRNPTGGISGGIHKIEGEKALYRFKKQYFNILTHSQRRYVTFRYYAVLAAAAKRRRWYAHALWYAGCSVLSSPVSFLRELKNILDKRKKYKEI